MSFTSIMNRCAKSTGRFLELTILCIIFSRLGKYHIIKICHIWKPAVLPLLNASVIHLQVCRHGAKYIMMANFSLLLSWLWWKLRWNAVLLMKLSPVLSNGSQYIIYIYTLNLLQCWRKCFLIIISRGVPDHKKCQYYWYLFNL